MNAGTRRARNALGLWMVGILIEVLGVWMAQTRLDVLSRVLFAYPVMAAVYWIPGVRQGRFPDGLVVIVGTALGAVFWAGVMYLAWYAWSWLLRLRHGE
jgi:hypothetical protein